MTMRTKFITDEQKQGLDLAFETPQKMKWVVRENPKLQAELNGLPKNKEELSSKLVNKVVDRIKSL